MKRDDNKREERSLEDTPNHKTPIFKAQAVEE